MTGRTFWDWAGVLDRMDLVRQQLAQHVVLTAIAVAAGLLIAFPLAVAIHRYRRLYGPVTGITGILYTIPSLALFALLIPFTGLSILTAEIGLVGYTLLILVRNISTGLAGVPEDVKEAALGMGYTRRELLWRVELPLALPALVAGLRIATVTTIGLVTVTALIGLGGLGHLMLGGFRRLYPQVMVVVGLGLSVALALLADALLLGGQRLLTPWARSRRGVVA